MVLNTEAHYKYKNLALNVLAKALDDICPKFETEPLTIRKELIKERISYFNEQEKLIDKEWRTLEKEAQSEVTTLKKERLQVIRKLEKTKKTSRIKLKIQHLERNKNKKVRYLNGKLKVEEQKLKKQLTKIPTSSKKFAQITNKLEKIKTDIQRKITSVTSRYDKIIHITLTSDNTKCVQERIKQSYEIWQRKFEKLDRQFSEKIEVHEHKRLENDQIRLVLEDFIQNFNLIKDWCSVAGIPVRMCYLEVKTRLELLGRNSKEIDELLRLL